MAVQKRTIVAEPFQADRIAPATATRAPRTDPSGGRMLVSSRRVEL
ncbi:hypothetical protein [Reyranella sp.]|nr:hypothetical protein [Reyranella sp.]